MLPSETQGTQKELLDYSANKDIASYHHFSGHFPAYVGFLKVEVACL
jgi:hypothetical protein